MSSDEHISQIPTLWSMVRRAHGDRVSQLQQAQQTMIDRYGGAARRYLLGALRNEDAADEVYQEFVLKFLRGDFRSADPKKGRFRSFLKTILYRMIVDHQRARKRSPTPQMPDDRITPIAEEQPPREEDEAFTRSWREALLAKAWRALEQEQEETGKPVHAVLRYRVDHPDLRSPELAAGLSRQLDREISPANVRVMLHRARERFANLLLDEVEQSLDAPTRDDLEAELIELQLIEYCRPVLANRNP
ncbi:MAG: sigma-70 family RNA polymerase sigma factor [Pirellulaceae bacterium]